jgi:hypothetical protein
MMEDINMIYEFERYGSVMKEKCFASDSAGRHEYDLHNTLTIS